MSREMRVLFGPAPHGLGRPLRERTWQLEGDTFVMRGTGEHYLHYRRGEGVTVERGPGADLAYESLWLAGTMHAAVACLNGLIPIHASAVAHAGGVYAFTGPSGAGKSTLIAALGRLGLPMVCDDTLVLDPTHGPASGPPMCLPGHKRLKLTPEAVALTGAAAQERVGTDVDKVYALPPAGDVGEALPLAGLFVIEDGDPLSIAPIVGGGKLRVLLTDHYTVDLLVAVDAGVVRDADGVCVKGCDGSGTPFERIGALASRSAMMRLTRPRDVALLGDVANYVAQWIRGRDRP